MGSLDDGGGQGPVLVFEVDGSVGDVGGRPTTVVVGGVRVLW